MSIMERLTVADRREIRFALERLALIPAFVELMTVAGSTDQGSSTLS